MNSKNVIRREQFRQIKNQISGSHHHLVVGIDVAKDKHHAFMGSANGKSLLRKMIFENNKNGFQKLLEQAEAVKIQHALDTVVFGIEPTGNYHKPLARCLIDNGCHLVMVTGKAVSKNRELLDGRWDKHDTKCAANIADLVSRSRFLYYDLPSDDLVQLRQLLSLRRRLKKQEHGLRMRIRNNLLAQYFPELDQFYSACESETLSIIRWWLDPKKLAAEDFDRFFTTVTKSRRSIAQKLRLQKIYRLAAESVGCPVGPTAEFEAQLLVGKLESVREQIKQVEGHMKQIAAQFIEYKWLLTIPGIGPYIAARILASIGDPERFDNYRQVIKLAGLDLCARRSGKSSDKAVPVISKNGNAEMRYAMYQAAVVASARNRHFMNYFTNMIRGRERERGIKTKMRVKLAAKMLVIAWTLMKKHQPFNPDSLKTE